MPVSVDNHGPPTWAAPSGTGKGTETETVGGGSARTLTALHTKKTAPEGGP